MKLEPDLTCCQASEKVIGQLMTGTMQFMLKCLLPSTHQKLECLALRYFLVLPKRWGVLSKTINDSNIDLERFPASKVRQLSKKMESSKSTTRHIKQVASDSQVTQVNLMMHQRTDLPPSRSKWKQHSHKSRSKSQKRYSSEDKNQGPLNKKKNWAIPGT